MPFRSKAQAKWMFSKHPEMAKRWAAHTASIKSLPQHVKEHYGKKK
jgi:phosphopantetheinyl transferase (holo-ACP synthase)